MFEIMFEKFNAIDFGGKDINKYLINMMIYEETIDFSFYEFEKLYQNFITEDIKKYICQFALYNDEIFTKEMKFYKKTKNN